MKQERLVVGLIVVWWERLCLCFFESLFFLNCLPWKALPSGAGDAVRRGGPEVPGEAARRVGDFDAKSGVGGEKAFRERSVFFLNKKEEKEKGF